MSGEFKEIDAAKDSIAIIEAIRDRRFNDADMLIANWDHRPQALPYTLVSAILSMVDDLDMKLAEWREHLMEWE